MNRLNKILLATDFSKTSDNALDHAAIIAAKNDAPLHVLHVHVLLQDVHGEKGFPERDRYQEVLDRFATEGLVKLRPQFGVPVEKKTIRDVSAAISSTVKAKLSPLWRFSERQNTGVVTPEILRPESRIM